MTVISAGKKLPSTFAAATHAWSLACRLTCGTALAAAMLSAPAFAATVDTSSVWDGSAFISSWGAPNTATYGQTITATAAQSRLTDMKFNLYLQAGTASQYQAFVYAWDATNQRITGSALFTSGTLTAPSAAAYTVVDVPTGSVLLTPGQQYVLFFTTSSLPAQSASTYRWASVANTAYTGGQFVYQNNTTTFSLLSSSTWSTIASDLWMQLALSPTAISPQLPSGATINQINVAAGIDNSVVTAGNAPPSSFSALYSLSGAALSAAVDQISGEIGADAVQSSRSAMDPFLSAMTQRVSSISAGVQPAESFKAAHVWGSFFGDGGSNGGDTTVVGSHNIHSGAFGLVLGSDFLVGDQTLVGGALSYGYDSFSLSTDELGSGRGKSYQVGLYASSRITDEILVSLSGAYARNRVDTSRTVTVSGTDHLVAKYDADTWGVRGEASYLAYANDTINLAPYAAVQYETFETPDYVESVASGSSAFALGYASHVTSTLRTELGLAIDHGFAIETGKLKLVGRAAWVHDDVTGGENAVANFISLPSSAFTVHGAALPTDGALVSFGIEHQTSLCTLSLKFNGLVGNKSETYGGSLSVNFKL